MLPRPNMRKERMRSLKGTAYKPNSITFTAECKRLMATLSI